jgi:hypothetical protein
MSIVKYGVASNLPRVFTCNSYIGYSTPSILSLNPIAF